MTNQAKTNNLNYLVDSTFNTVNKFCCVRASFSKCYTPAAEIKY